MGALTGACALIAFSFLCSCAFAFLSLAMSAPAPVPAAAATATATAPGKSAICQAAEAFVRQELAGNDAVSWQHCCNEQQHRSTIECMGGLCNVFCVLSCLFVFFLRSPMIGTTSPAYALWR
jgi:hypothetical protein